MFSKRETIEETRRATREDIYVNSWAPKIMEGIAVESNKWCLDIQKDIKRGLIAERKNMVTKLAPPTSGDQAKNHKPKTQAKTEYLNLSKKPPKSLTTA